MCCQTEGHLLQGFRRQVVGVGKHGGIIGQDLGVAQAGQHLDREHLLHRVLEAQKRHRLPRAESTTHTPQLRSASARSAMGMPLKTALSRTCDRPTNARLP